MANSFMCESGERERERVLLQFSRVYLYRKYIKQAFHKPDSLYMPFVLFEPTMNFIFSPNKTIFSEKTLVQRRKKRSESGQINNENRTPTKQRS